MLSRDRRSEPGDVPGAEGAAAREGQPGEEIPGEPGDDKRAVEDDRRAARRPHEVEAAVARRSRTSSSRSARRSVARAGRDVTRGHLRPQRAAVRRSRPSELAGEGIEAEVIDLRSLYPYDWDAIKQSVRKTNRVLFVNEDTEVTNFGEHLIRRIVEELFYELHAPPKLLAGAHVPGIGLADNLEMASVPQKDGIVAAIRELAKHEP